MLLDLHLSLFATLKAVLVRAPTIYKPVAVVLFYTTNIEYIGLA